ncbi:uncharacterized protein PGTG_05744 [Puccinia graminis f. sp. tritici CRL 75-36-700-3]|uniref:Uncharacterized protein n=1 Tax=Puccinia graminis f. sp. tritici (strain CRL 75-36-700-3 / race SCCL) TaxID=418459 RepID=E3K4J6_PUCGT|nr:uncharacterized protein PGTG_05744 [Puccinia graminis f. sp. tritici CRL 75-36-700-3]EFP79423.2 hypothetical protein PGTG_05744 [Puccinia graminis f. sp. tritici CRL 75-36-700-3]
MAIYVVGPCVAEVPDSLPVSSPGKPSDETARLSLKIISSAREWTAPNVPRKGKHALYDVHQGNARSSSPLDRDFRALGRPGFRLGIDQLQPWIEEALNVGSSGNRKRPLENEHILQQPHPSAVPVNRHVGPLQASSIDNSEKRHKAELLGSDGSCTTPDISRDHFDSNLSHTFDKNLEG